MRKFSRIILITSIVFMIINSFNISKAAQTKGIDGAGVTTKQNSSSTSSSTSSETTLATDINPDEYKPDVEMPDSIKTKTGKIIGIITTIGIIVSVVAIAMVGLNYVIGSASEKAIEKEKLVGVMIGATLLLAGSTIVKIISNVAGQF